MRRTLPARSPQRRTQRPQPPPYAHALATVSDETWRRRLGHTDLSDCKPKDIPLSSGADFSATTAKDKPFADGSCYAECVGALMYISCCTRPDLAYAASCLAKHMANPCERHWLQLKFLGRYLSATKTAGIVFRKDAPAPAGYVDSDYAACKDSRKSRTGFIFLAASGPISWASKQQNVVATSTAEAEYIAAAHAAREAICLKRVLHFLGNSTEPAMVLHCDNQAALHMAKNSSDTVRTKHIDVVHHFLRDCVSRRLIRMVYIPTDDNPADMFTKALSAPKFSKFSGLIGVV